MLKVGQTTKIIDQYYDSETGKLLIFHLSAHTHTQVINNKSIKEPLEKGWKKKGKFYMKFCSNYSCSDSG